MEAKIYNQTGKEAGTIKLPEHIFGLPSNKDLVHQVIVSMQSNARTPVAHTKDRSEVSGGGKKPWKQKGTGRARHGSSRSPIWIGGGVTHGPRNERSFSQKINKKMRTKALFVTLSEKLRSEQVLLVDNISLSDVKTKEAKNILSKLSSISGFDGIMRRNNAALFITPQKEESLIRAFRNFGNISLKQSKDINPVDILAYKHVVFVSPQESIKVLEGRISSEKKKVEGTPKGTESDSIADKKEKKETVKKVSKKKPVAKKNTAKTKKTK